MERRFVFPFTAIVGQEKAKLGLLCCAVNPTIGGILLAGEKGSGKSTLVRALSQVLPEIEVAKGCPFGCNPNDPTQMCDFCCINLHKIEVITRKMRVIDLPLSITVDRLVGTLDIKKAISEGTRALQPGLLAEANRNILYIDEVNLLDDYVADVLLDCTAMGWSMVEREGISVKHPARFILVGSMNPEEGELRPQILDRFGLYVPIEVVKDPVERMEIVHRVEEFHKDPEAFYRKHEDQEEALMESVEKARKLIGDVTISQELFKLLIDTVIKLDIRTHRAEITTVKTAKAIAALDGRSSVSLEDLKKAMELTLPHRPKSKPLEPPPPPPPPPPPTTPPNPSEQSSSSNTSTPTNKQVQQSESSTSCNKPDDKIPGNAEMLFNPDKIEIKQEPNKERVPPTKTSPARGSRDLKLTKVACIEGHPIAYTLPSKSEHLQDIDIMATLNASAARNAVMPLVVEDEDFRVRLRKKRTPRLSVILLDSSGSMGFLKRMSIAKSITKELVRNSYRKRDLMALVVFRGHKAEVIVPPTKRYEAIFEALQNLPTGGKTPLPSALQQLLFLAKSFKMKNKEGVIRGFLVTDGKGNVSVRANIQEDIKTFALAVKNSGIYLEVHDTRPHSTLVLAPSYIELLAQLTEARVFTYN